MAFLRMKKVRFGPLRTFSTNLKTNVLNQYTFGHFLEQRETFLQSIGNEAKHDQVAKAQSKLMGLLNKAPQSQPTPDNALIDKAGLGGEHLKDQDAFGPNKNAKVARDLVTLRQMMACSMHLGHTASRWNPKMAPYIYGERAGIHIINLESTLVALRQACNVVTDIASKGGIIVFVGTSPNIQRLTYEAAQDCAQHYVNVRWIGGTLTNRTQILRTDKLVPDLLIVLDPIPNEKALKEAEKCCIPVIALCDTNFDPTSVTYPIPANDDAYSSIELVARTLSLAAAQGRQVRIAQPLRSSDIYKSATSFIESVFDKTRDGTQ